MAAIDRIRSAASGAVVIGTAVGARAARSAGPLLARLIGAVRHRDRPQEPASRPPTPSRPEPTDDRPTASRDSAAPTPSAVARNIAPHPPAPRARTKPAKRSAPGAKLPVRRPTAD